ncbi:MAG: hypothetical protein ACFB50_17745 [Rubrobacteraceae bacterium]
MLIRAYPGHMRERYGEEMVRCFSDACRDQVRSRGLKGLAAVWLRTLPDLAFTAFKERSIMSNQNARRAIIGIALATAFILLGPLLAMQFTGEVVWTLADFLFAGVIIFGTGLAYVLVARKTRNTAYRAAVGLALAAAFILVWAAGAVGIIGSEDNPANLMYVGVLAVGIAGTLIVRFEPEGMARTMVATAVVQGLIAGIALIYGLGGAAEIVLPNGFFVGLFAGSALLFRHAARERSPAGAPPEG